MKKSTKNSPSESADSTQTLEQPSLLLVEGKSSDSHWVLDEKTRQSGRAGIAKARAALQATRPAHLDIAA